MIGFLFAESNILVGRRAVGNVSHRLEEGGVYFIDNKSISFMIIEHGQVVGSALLK